MNDFLVHPAVFRPQGHSGQERFLAALNVLIVRFVCIYNTVTSRLVVALQSSVVVDGFLLAEGGGGRPRRDASLYYYIHTSTILFGSAVGIHPDSVRPAAHA